MYLKNDTNQKYSTDGKNVSKKWQKSIVPLILYFLHIFRYTFKNIRPQVKKMYLNLCTDSSSKGASGSAAEASFKEIN